MKKTTMLLCLLLVAAPASAGGVVLVLPLDASLVDVSAPDNATVSSTVAAGHVVVSVTGPPGPVVVTGDLNGSAVVVAAYVPADAPEPVDLAPVLAAQAALSARVLDFEAEVAEYNTNANEDRETRRQEVFERFAALLADVAALDARVVDVQNGTATVSSQLQGLDEDVQAVAQKEAPARGLAVGWFVVLLLLVVHAGFGVLRDGVAWWRNRDDSGEGEGSDAVHGEGIRFMDSEE